MHMALSQPRNVFLDISSLSCLLTGMITVKPVEHEVKRLAAPNIYKPGTHPVCYAGALDDFIGQVFRFDIRHPLKNPCHSGGCSMGGLLHHQNHGGC